MLLVAHDAQGCYSFLSLVFKPSSPALQQCDFCMTVDKKKKRKSLGSLTLSAKLESQQANLNKENRNREKRNLKKEKKRPQTV